MGAPAGAVALILLTGGASRRMGRDKASLDAGGVPLALRAVHALRDVCAEVVLAGASVAGVPGRVMPDAAPGRGPLAGVVGGLRATAAARAVVVGCDMPAVNPALVRLLLDALGDDPAAVQAAVCVRDGRIEPLPMALRANALGPLEAAMAGGARALRDGLAVLRTATAPEVMWRPVDPAGVTFENWNHPGDVHALPRLDGGS